MRIVKGNDHLVLEVIKGKRVDYTVISKIVNSVTSALGRAGVCYKMPG